MVEHYKKAMGSRWAFTDAASEIPQKILDKILSESGLDPTREPIRAAAFTDSLGARGTVFVVVTDERVVAKKLTSLHQTRFVDLTGVGRSYTDDVVLHAAGKKSDLFSMMEMPKKALIDKLFGIITQRWNDVRGDAAPVVRSAPPEAPAVVRPAPPEPTSSVSPANAPSGGDAAMAKEAARPQASHSIATGQPTRVWHQQGWATPVILASLLFVAPVGIVLLWLSGKFSQTARVALSVVSAALFVAVLATPTSEEKSGEKNSTEKAIDAEPAVQYEVLKNKVSDTPTKTQITLQVLVRHRPLSPETLKSLLRRLHKRTKKRGGFEHRKHPSAVYIYAFATIGQASGGWVAMLQVSHNDSTPTITVDGHRLDLLSKPAQVKFGLSESSRREVYRARVVCEVAATTRAEKRFKTLKKIAAYQGRLQARCKKALRKKHKVDARALDGITVEGIRAGWATEAAAVLPAAGTGLVDPLLLKVKARYVVSRRTPLMPHYDPSAPLEAIKRMKQLPAGTEIEILRKKSPRPTSAWYQVRVVRTRATGWVNAIALMGQKLEKSR